KLHMIEQAENILRDLGFYDVRVRHHELTGSVRDTRVTDDTPRQQQLAPLDTRTSTLPQHLARIEVGQTELPRLLANGLATKVAEKLKQIGYTHVTVDLQGYRRGSLNDVLKASQVV